MPDRRIIPQDPCRGAAEAIALSAKLLANPDRLRLLWTIAEGECTVGELAAQLHILQPTLSQQLAVLRRAGSVKTRRLGKYIYYRIDDPKLTELLAALKRICTAKASDGRV